MLSFIKAQEKFRWGCNTVIHIEDNVVMLKGTPKELTKEFTHCILSFKETMMNEFQLKEEEIYKIIAKCGEIAFMSNEERQEYLNALLEGDK
jgi:hypothetical protein